MKTHHPNLATPASLVMIGLIAIAAVAIALYQVNQTGTLAPTAPESQPAAVEISSNTCTVEFIVPEAAQADLELRKFVDDPSPDVGQLVTFTIELTNRGPNNAAGVVVRDVLPAGLAYSSYTADRGTYDPTTGNWNVGAINVNEVLNLHLVATVQNAGQIVNYTQITASNLPDPDSVPNNNSTTEDDDDSVTLNSTSPTIDLDLVKRVSNTNPAVGNSVTFTIQVRNSGPRTATNVTVQDILGTGLSYLSHSTATGSYDSQTGIWTIGSIPVNAMVELEMVARLDQAITTNNYAQIRTSSPTDIDSTPGNNSGRDGNPGEDDDSTVVLIPVTPTPTPTLAAGSADLSVDKRVSNSTPAINDEITYYIEVYNAGPDTATNVQLHDPLTSGLTYLSHTTSQGSYNNSTGIWDIGTINVNEIKVLTIRARVSANGSLTNVAQITQNNPTDPNLNNNRDTQTINSNDNGADLSLTKRVNNSTPQRGENVVFTIEVHNSGPRQADNVTVRDLLPTGVTFVAANPTQGSYNSGNGIWTIGSLTKDSTVRLDLTVRVDSSTGIRNIAEVWTSSMSDPDSTPGNNNPSEDDYDEATLGPRVELPKSGTGSQTTLFVLASGVVVLIIGAMSLLLLL